jgi:hypothetical protein
MKTDPGANRGEGVPFPVQSERFGVTPLTNEGNKPGNIDRGGTGALAGCPDETRADTGITMFISDMSFVFVAEVPDG